MMDGKDAGEEQRISRDCVEKGGSPVIIAEEFSKYDDSC
jgi:hypothetical protein